MSVTSAFVKYVKITLVVCLLMVAHPLAASEILASWNIRNLGWNNGKDFTALGVVGSHLDFIAVQEVMSDDGIRRFQESLEAETRTVWDRSCSHFIGRGSYREQYCFVWRKDSIQLEGSETVFIDSRDVFAREPYSAIFRTASGFRFLATSIHAIYGNSVAERQREAEALRGYYEFLVESFPGVPVFLMGDFNLAPTNPAWAALGEIMHPLIQDGATTISKIDGRFANLYDNIWVQAQSPLPIISYGRLEFPHQVLGITHEEARDSVSDHIPVWVEIDGSASPALFPPHEVTGQQRSQRAQPHSDPDASDASDGSVIGNRNSMIYHLPHCPSYSRVSHQNQVRFKSSEDAVSAGFRRAGNCS